MAKNRSWRLSGTQRPSCAANWENLVEAIQKYDAYPENVTTPSLEALQAYTLGNQTIDVANSFAAGIPHGKGRFPWMQNFAMADIAVGPELSTPE